MGPLRDLLHRVDGPQDVGAVGDGDQLRPLSDQLVILLHPQGPVVVYVDPLDDDPQQILQEVPRDGVGVVLHHRRDYLVALLQVPLEAPAIGYRVDALRCPAGVDHLLGAAGVDHLEDSLSSLLELLGGLLPDLIYGPVDVGRVGTEVLLDFVDDLDWLLGRGRVI